MKNKRLSTSDKVTRQEFDEIGKRVDRLEYQMHSRSATENTIDVLPTSHEEEEDDLPF